MTREEEIEKTAKRYIDNKLNLNKSIKSAFIDGVEWADKHPNFEKIWHNIEEEPEDHHIIICQDKKGYTWIQYHIINTDWEYYIKELGLSQWAYIKDLLPKGGEK